MDKTFNESIRNYYDEAVEGRTINLTLHSDLPRTSSAARAFLNFTSTILSALFLSFATSKMVIGVKAVADDWSLPLALLWTTERALLGGRQSEPFSTSLP